MLIVMRADGRQIALGFVKRHGLECHEATPIEFGNLLDVVGIGEVSRVLFDWPIKLIEVHGRFRRSRGSLFCRRM